MKKALKAILLIAIFLSWSSASFAQTPECDQRSPLYNLQECFRLTTGSSNIQSAGDVFDVLENIGGFLISAAGIVAGIVIIVAGLMWMAAGSNPARVTSAKAVFKNGIIGAIILFAAGIIVSTIVFLGSDPLGFFS